MIRPATPADVPTLHTLIRELAAYEKAPHEARATQEQLHEALFGERPAVYAHIAVDDTTGETVGCALWFLNFSTWRGVHGIYLEDLYVRPDARHAGVGGALLKALAKRCVLEGLGRMGWLVLNWNEPAIEFYQGLGATIIDEWSGARLEGEALSRLGSEP